MPKIVKGSWIAVVLGVLVVAGAPAPVTAAPTAPDITHIEAELARVQQELRDQRQLILQLMQMHDALLKYVQMNAGSATASSAPPPGTAFSGAPATPAEKEVVGAESAAAIASRALISGKVHGASAAGEAYVYVDGPKVVSSHPATIEVKQQGRQFVPAVSVLQVGGRVLFPNEDKVFHNVFSKTPGDAFDLGTLKSGDRPNPVVLLKPGHVEVFCNIHSRMRADILVVPNAHWARVRADGSFQIPGVPLGSYNVVLWGPAVKPVSQRVEVTPAGTTVTFAAESLVRRPHLNKQGGAYESYEN